MENEIGRNPSGILLEKSSGLAVTSLVLGILSLTCCGLPAGIGAIICGMVERSQIRKQIHPQKGWGFATAGLILGIISIVIGCIALIFVVIYWAAILAMIGTSGLH